MIFEGVHVPFDHGHLERGRLISLWSSTPCTGGSPWQHLLVASRGDEYRRGRLARHWALHRKLWKSFTILSTYVHGWAIEWPKRCAYWGWNQTRKFLSSRNYLACRLYLLQRSMAAPGTQNPSWQFRHMTIFSGTPCIMWVMRRSPACPYGLDGV